MKSTFLQQRLVYDLGYSKEQADFIEADIHDLHSDLKPVFDAWLKENSMIRDYGYKEFSITFFMEQCDMNFIAALLTMDWILKEPKEAIPLIKLGIM